MWRNHHCIFVPREGYVAYTDDINVGGPGYSATGWHMANDDSSMGLMCFLSVMYPDYNAYLNKGSPALEFIMRVYVPAQST